MDLKAILDYGYSLEKSDLDSKRIENGGQNVTVKLADRQQKTKAKNMSTPKTTASGNACIAEEHFPIMEEEIHAQPAELSVVHAPKLVTLQNAAY